MDADLVDRALTLLAESAFDYVSNCVPPTYPDGLDVEAFTMSALATAWSQARLASEREHVTPYLREPRYGMKVGNWQGFADLSGLRWTVDHPDDLTHVRQLVADVASTRPSDFDRFDIYRVIEKQARQQQVAYARNEGYIKSLSNDHIVQR
jgi:spore coat polysaccharide biosynthesis protein SpsF (cytidylyltransferase family)